MLWNIKISRELTTDEKKAIIEAQLLLERVFRRPVFSVSINKDNEDSREVFGISYALNMRAKGDK